LIELSIRVIPRAGKAGPAGMRDQALLVRLTAPPVEGAANRELIDVLAHLFDVPRRSITIVAGERSRNKRVRIEGVDADAIARTIAGLGLR
jgi:uncharacterized protein (TIGR00251 family)